MSYSFTDGEEETLTSSTIMVPFVDLLNHSSEHHAQLTFTHKALELMVVRDIEEVVSTSYKDSLLTVVIFIPSVVVWYLCKV